MGSKIRTLWTTSALSPVNVFNQGAGAIPFDYTVDTLDPVALDLTQPCPSQISGVDMYSGKSVLLIKQPTNLANGVYVEGDDGFLHRPADWASGSFIVSPVAGRGYIVHVTDSDGSTDASEEDTYWSMNQLAGIIVDTNGNTWTGPISVTATTIPAGTVEGGNTNPKANASPPTDVRLTEDHLPMTKRGLSGSTRRPIHWPIYRHHYLSDFMRPDLQADARNAFNFVFSNLPAIDELIVDMYCLRFSGVLTIPLSWSNKRIIFDPGRGRGDHVKIWTEASGIFKIAAKGLEFQGNCYLQSVNQETGGSVNNSGVWLDAGAQDIIFRDGLIVDGFGRGIYCPTGVDGLEVYDFNALNVGLTAVDFFSNSGASPVKNVRFHRANLTLGTTVITAPNAPVGFKLGANVGGALASGVEINRLNSTGGFNAVQFSDAAASGVENSDFTDRPRNCWIRDGIITGTTGDGIALTYGSDIYVERMKVDLAGDNGIKVARTFQGRAAVRDCQISSAQHHGIWDDAVEADRRIYSGNTYFANGQAAANSYDGFHASDGSSNITLLDSTSGHDQAARSAFGTMTIGASNLADGNTLVLNGTTLTWRTTPTLPLEVQLVAPSSTNKAANLFNLITTIAANAGDAQLSKIRVATDEVSQLSMWWKTPGDTAGNSFTLAKVGGGMTLSGATLSGAAGTINQQRYGYSNVQDGFQGNRAQGLDGTGNASGPVGLVKS